jgi:heptosyltransferase-1
VPPDIDAAWRSARRFTVKILLVKLSSLGDVVHTLPVVQDILSARPDARIDWVVEKSFAPLLTPLVGHGLRRVVSCELRRWRKSPFAAETGTEWLAFRQELQSEEYDAVIDLQGLTKSALVAWLARLSVSGRRYAMANRTEGSAYKAITLEPHSHAVQRARELCARALAYTLAPLDFGLKGALALMERAPGAPETIAFVHGSSRADKQWPLANWVALGRQINALGYRIGLPHGSADELATSQAIAAELNAGSASAHAAVWPRMPLDLLTHQLAQCAGVIGVDSGLSHIAVALDLPHVQIYNFDTAWRTGPSGVGQTRTAGAVEPEFCQVSVFAHPAPTVQAVWDAWLKCQPVADGEADR